MIDSKFVADCMKSLAPGVGSVKMIFSSVLLRIALLVIFLHNVPWLVGLLLGLFADEHETGAMLYWNVVLYLFYLGALLWCWFNADRLMRIASPETAQRIDLENISADADSFASLLRVGVILTGLCFALLGLLDLLHLGWIWVLSESLSAVLLEVKVRALNGAVQLILGVVLVLGNNTCVQAVQRLRRMGTDK